MSGFLPTGCCIFKTASKHCRGGLCAALLPIACIGNKVIYYIIDKSELELFTLIPKDGGNCFKLFLDM